MVKKIVFVSLLIATAAAAQAEESVAAFPCEDPEFPTLSTSTEGARRVEKRMLAWRRCAQEFMAQHTSPAAVAAVKAAAQRVGSRHIDWQLATFRYSNGQARTQINQARAASNAMGMAGLTAARGTPYYVVRPDEKPAAGEADRSAAPQPANEQPPAHQ